MATRWRQHSDALWVPVGLAGPPLATAVELVGGSHRGNCSPAALLLPTARVEIWLLKISSSATLV
jgi:hypothetical protein